MDDVIKLITSLIRFELSGDKPDSEVSELCGSDNLEELYCMSVRHDIAHMVADALYKNGLLKNNADIAEKFKNAQLGAVYRYMKFESEIQQIYAVLEKVGISFIPLKGAVIRNFYAEPYMRTSCDIDILVHEYDCERAALCLKDELKYTQLPGKTLHDCQLESPDGVHLELHFTLIEDNCMPKTSSVLEKVWEYANTADLCTYRCEMCEEMFMFYHIAHMAKHFLNGGCGIRAFMDLWLLEEKISFDLGKLNELLKKTDLLTFYESSLKLCSVWFGSEKHTLLTRNMEFFVFGSGVYGTLENQAAINFARGDNKAVSVLKLIFLPRKNLEVLYPELKQRPYLCWFYQIKRWLRAFNKDKRNKIKAEGKMIFSVSNEKKSEVKALLNSLNLAGN